MLVKGLCRAKRRRRYEGRRFHVVDPTTEKAWLWLGPMRAVYRSPICLYNNIFI